MKTPKPYEMLVDHRTGLIKKLFRQQLPGTVPPALAGYGAEVADARRFGPWAVDLVAMGSAFNDQEQAKRAAIGEAVERYCGNFIPKDLPTATYLDLVAAGERALNPEALVLYAPEQYRQPGFPFVPFTDDLAVLWVQARDLYTNEITWVPASVTYINYFTGPCALEPRTNFVMYSGIAAGETREAAERSALAELIERDAVMLWWLGRGPAIGLDISDTPPLAAVIGGRGAPESPLYHFVSIPNGFGLPVIGALVEDTARQIAVLGMACRTDPMAATQKALAEAIYLWVFAQGLLDPEGHVWKAIRAGVFDPRAYKPYRADRTYQDAYRRDYRDMIDLGSHAQIYLDPRMIPHTHHITHPDVVIPFSHLPVRSQGHDRAHYLDALRNNGFTALSVDITTSDVAAAGLSVVRVIVPGLYPNGPAAFPFLGGRRLYEEPVKLGWRDAPLTIDDINLVPLPHT